MWDKLIAVTDSATCPRPLAEQLERISTYKHKPQAILLRAKDLTAEEYACLAEAAIAICRCAKIPLILHSHWQLAIAMSLPSIQVPLPLLRSKAFQEQISYFTDIYTSIHRKEEIAEAAALGATALIAGHIYRTQCKEGLPPRGLKFLREACQEAGVFKLPVYAIGGIKFSSGQLEEIKNAGAKGACIMSGYMKI